MHVQNIGTQNVFAKKVYRKLGYQNREKVTKVSLLGQKDFLAKRITCPTELNTTYKALGGYQRRKENEQARELARIRNG